MTGFLYIIPYIYNLFYNENESASTYFPSHTFLAEPETATHLLSPLVRVK